jgi:preprotein translocase subunit SecA
MRDLGRLNRLKGPALDRALAMAREAAIRGLGLRPFPCQIMGALAMIKGWVAEMATGEGKTITAALAASHLGLGRQAGAHHHGERLSGGPRRGGDVADLQLMGNAVGHVIHETNTAERHGELPAQRRVRHQQGTARRFPARSDCPGHAAQQHADGREDARHGARPGAKLLVPGLFKVIVDEADSLLVDEGVTPLIISGSPDGEESRPMRRFIARRTSWPNCWSATAISPSTGRCATSI